ncbi:MAG: HK97 gp10 family phage protein [Eubacteriales bacterium]|nr:HK97 gp10 family phage protein [Eubacteriales bacterium]MDD4390315.1 HK97 gp10 family phage protein [Eubacteriales bacterium]
MINGFNTKELTQFQNELINLAQKKMPKESKKFLRDQGKSLRKDTVALAKARTKKKSGNLYKSIKTGKVYVFKGNGGLSIRVYGGKPAYHVHLLEYGHRQVTKDGKEVGFVKGKHFFKDAAKGFESKHYNDVQKFLDTVLDKGLV